MDTPGGSAPAPQLRAPRVALGMSELLFPRAILLPFLRSRPFDCSRPFDWSQIDGRAVWVVRVLGARQLGQAVLTGTEPKFTGLGAVVDAIHGASMVALAVRSLRWRRAALSEAAMAAALSIAGGCAAWRRNRG